MTILYIQNLKRYAHAKNTRANKFSKVVGYIINPGKSVMFLCNGSDQSEKEIKIIPLIIASEIIKYIGINLSKGVKDLFIDNYKTLLK